MFTKALNAELNGDQERQLASWPTPELEQFGAEVAIQTAQLLSTERLWVRRRVEKFSFVDGDRVRREMSIDFMTPSERPEGCPNSVFFAPIALPRKAVLRDLDVRDEEGRALPMLTRDENAAISSSLLRALAVEVISEQPESLALDEEIALDLADVAGSRYGVDDDPSEEERRQRVMRTLENFRAAAASKPGDNASDQRQIIWADLTMRTYVELLADRFVLIVRLAGCDLSERRIIKLSYEERIQDSPHGREGSAPRSRESSGPKPRSLSTIWGQRRETIGWKPYGLTFPTRSLYAASTYHAEIAVPDDLFIAKAKLGRVVEYINIATGDRIRSGGCPIHEREGVSRAHLYGTGVAPGAGIPSRSGFDLSELAFIDVEIRLRPGSILPLLIASSLIVSILFLGLLLRAVGVHADPGTSASLLIAVPGVFAVFLVPGGHRLVRRMYQGVRALTVFSALCAFVAASFLALRLPTAATYAAWIVLFALATLSTIALYVPFFASLRRR